MDVQTLSHGDKVKQSILDMGLKLWRDNVSKVTIRNIADKLHMSHANVIYHFGSMAALKEAIAYRAVACNDSKIIVQLIANKHPAIASMSPETRSKHFNSLG